MSQWVQWSMQNHSALDRVITVPGCIYICALCIYHGCCCTKTHTKCATWLTREGVFCELGSVFPCHFRAVGDIVLFTTAVCCESIIHTLSHIITSTSWWPRWRLKSPASRLFTQSFIRAQTKESIKAPRHWPLCGELTGTGEFPAQRASNAENVSIWWRRHAVMRPYLPIFLCMFLFNFDKIFVQGPVGQSVWWHTENSAERL